MPLGWTVRMEVVQDRRGGTTLRLLSSGHHRFTLELWDGEEVIFELHGFRINQSLSAILPPRSSTPDGKSYDILEMTPKGMQMLVNEVRKVVKASRDQLQGATR